MAGNHHNCYHHHQPQSYCSTTSNGCYCCPSSAPPPQHYYCHSPPPPPPPPNPCIPSHSDDQSRINSLLNAAYLANSYYQPPLQQEQSNTSQHYHQLKPLLHRMSALESALQQLNVEHSPPGSHHQYRARGAGGRTKNQAQAPAFVRNLAARTIQRHFRSFLVRRSQTLRHLKLIAVTQCHVCNLQERLSDKFQLSLLIPKPQAVQELVERAMDLLAHIDSIRSRDRIVREAKRSVSRDLARVLDVLDGVSSSPAHGKQAGGRFKREKVDSDDKIMKTHKQLPLFGSGRVEHLRGRGSGYTSGIMEDAEGMVPSMELKIRERDVVSRLRRKVEEHEDEEEVAEMLKVEDGGGRLFSTGRSLAEEEEEERNGFPGFQTASIGGYGLSPLLPLKVESGKGGEKQNLMDLKQQEKIGVRFHPLDLTLA